jgi:serine/threonine protein kinase
MATPRIGKRELLAREKTRTAPRSNVVARGLASPLGILLIFPGLVLAVGVFLTLAGHRALKGSNVEMAQQHIDDQASLVARGLRNALEQAEPVLDRLGLLAASHEPSQPFERAASVLRDLLQGHPGFAYTSISFPDGTFQGAYKDDDGAVRFQDSRVTPEGTHVRRFDYRARDTLALRSEEQTRYDPRTRDFYTLALGTGRRVWTKPYPFYGTHYTGITRAEAVFAPGAAGQRRLVAVVTVDFDVNELSKLLGAGELPEMRTLLFAPGGTLLAYPQGKSAIAKLPLQSERALGYRELHDPLLDAFFTARTRKPAQGARLLDLNAAGTRYLAAVAAVNADPSLGWNVAYLVPEQVFFRGLNAYGRRSVAIAAAAVLLALGAAVSFARLVVRVRREAADARAEAQRANLQARELGSYRLITCLGKGGMGEVWRAEHRLLARQAAIKLIRLDGEGTVSGEQARERFRREAQTLAALRSRNTIEIFDYGIAEDGTFFYVMELLDGSDLETLVSSHGPQPASRVIRLLIQACSSLAEAHDAGLVHRDIKPANLFVCRAADEVDVLKVLDFGLVRSLDGDPASSEQASDAERSEAELVFSAVGGKLTQAGNVMGTPEYIAPEQALGQETDGRSDLYALGCVGFWLLTGKVPFERANTLMLLLAHIQDTPPELKPLMPGPLPEGLERALRACLAKAREDRPQTARELLAQLRAIEVPAEQAWTDDAAHSWWQKHHPAAVSRGASSNAPAPRELSVLNSAQ